MNELRFKIVTLFAPALLLLGCTYTWNINITNIDDYPLPLIEPLPINVCVYYGNDFRTYKKIQLNDYSQEVTSICNMQSQPIKKYQLVIRYGTLYNYGRLVF